MRRRLKKFLSKKLPLMIFLLLIFLYMFMAYGYAILKTDFNINGSAIINSPEEEKWRPKLKFVKISQIENVFFYEITIENDSRLTCYEWKLRIQDTEYISFPFGIDAVREDNAWVLNNTKWDSRIEPGGTVILNITFQVELSSNNSMTPEEYAKYFTKRYITISANTEDKVGRDGTIITEGKATLTLNENEEELKDFKIEKNINHIPETENEKQYILTIYNNSDKDYFRIRVNMYLENVTLVGISPIEVICNNINSITFKVARDVELEKNKAVSVYITLISEDDNFNRRFDNCSKFMIKKRFTKLKTVCKLFFHISKKFTYNKIKHKYIIIKIKQEFLNNKFYAKLKGGQKIEKQKKYYNCSSINCSSINGSRLFSICYSTKYKWNCNNCR